jgi:hypothetical protein
MNTVCRHGDGYSQPVPATVPQTETHPYRICAVAIVAVGACVRQESLCHRTGTQTARTKIAAHRNTGWCGWAGGPGVGM